MAALFPRWSNTAFRATIAVVVVGGIATLAALMIYVRTPWRRNEYERVDQPVLFDHRHHVQDDAIDCLYCHSQAEKAATAGVPSTDLCMGCHSQIWNDSLAL